MNEQMVVSAARAREEMDAKTKPLGALGRLEDVGVRLAVLQKTLTPRVDRARVCVFGADHGVTDEGVSAYPRAVTGEMMKNFDRGGAAINVIAASANIEVEVIDAGVDADLGRLAQIRHEGIRRSSRNLMREAAMTAEELRAAMKVGADAARRARDDGMQVLGLGEMGIGNTTSASTLLCLLGAIAPEHAVGRGTGVDDEGLQRKRDVVTRAIDLHRAGCDSGIETLRRVGGLEIGAIAGAALEGAALDLAIIADGFISSAAVLTALRIAHDDSLERGARLARSLFFAHRSAELGHRLVLDQCAAYPGVDATPLLDLGLRLGEGTGAALAIPLLRAAAAVMRDMATFASAGVSAGEHASAHGV